MTLELTVEPSSDEFEPTDPRWARQVNDLTQLLRKEAQVRSQVGSEQVGAKGDPLSVAIILALGSSGAIAAVSRIFAIWLSGRKRQLKVKYRDGDRVVDFEVESEGISAEHLQKLTDKLAG